MARGVTLLVALRDLLVRADVEPGRGGAVRALERHDPHRDLPLVDRLEIAARSGEELAPRTFVLTDDVFAQTLEMEARPLRGLSVAELAGALSFEAQMSSGLPGSDAALAWREGDAKGGTRRFLVQEIAKHELLEIEERLRELGTRLAGVLHPAGVPAALGPRANGRFRRVERWPDVVAVVEAAAGSNGALPAVNIRRADAAARAVPARDEADAATTETLAAPGVGAIEGSSLEDEARLRAWLATWARVLVPDAKGTSAPRIVPAMRPLSAGRCIALALALVLVVAAVVFLDRRVLQQELDRLDVAARQARDPIDRLARARAEVATLEQELRDLASGRLPTTVHADGAFDARTPALLLGALANVRPPGIMLDALQVRSTGERLGVIQGHAVTLPVIDELVRGLNEALRLDGAPLAVAPETSTLAATGLYSFELALTRERAP
jgi:hypothetical protein